MLIGNVEEAVEHYDLMTAVMICLGNSDGENYSGVLKLLDVLFSEEMNQEEKRTVLQDDFDIPMTLSIERGISSMCNLSEGVWQKGIQEGMQQGIVEGSEKTLLEDIRSLMVTMKWTAEQAMAALRVPETKRTEYAAKL